jgi:hypothetical protein
VSMHFRDGATQLEMFDAKERQRVAVGCGTCGEGMFAVFDVHENVKVGLLGRDGGPGTIHLAQAAGNVVAGLQITDQGHFVVMMDQVGDASSDQAGETPAGSYWCDRTPLDLDPDLKN